MKKTSLNSEHTGKYMLTTSHYCAFGIILSCYNTTRPQSSPYTRILAYPMFIHFSRMSELAESDRWTIVALHNEGYTVTRIHNLHGYSRPTIYRWIRTYERTGTVADEYREGRPTKVTRAVQQAIRQQMRNKRRRSSRYMAHKLARDRTASLTYRTVQSAAHDMGLHPFKVRNIPNITPSIQQRRIAFAHAYANQDWREVLFVDEKKFQLWQRGNNKDDVVWSYKKDDIPQRRLVRNAPYVTVWAGICINGKTPLHFVHGSLNSAEYIHILEHTMLPAAQRLFTDNTWLLLQDSATAHTAATTLTWLNNHNIRYISPNTWPSNSPDFNPIENIWSILNEKIQCTKVRTRDGLMRAIQHQWNCIPVDTIVKLIASIPARLRRCIQTRGKYTQ
jgi:transposase